MPRPRIRIGAIGASVAMAGLSLAVAGTPAGAAGRPGYVRVAATQAPWATPGRALGVVSASKPLNVELWLKPRVAAAAAFAASVSTPGAASYRHYLTPDAYTARFAATAAQADAVTDWLRREGFTAVTVDSQRAYVAASAPTSVVERAFRVQERYYPTSATVNAGGTALFANDRDVSLPASIAPSVIGVTGTDDVAPVQTIVGVEKADTTTTACSTYYAQHRESGLPGRYGKTSFPSYGCGYSAKQLRSAYGQNRVNTGKGVTIALTELGLVPNGFETLADYAKRNGMPKPSSARYQELALGRAGRCGNFDVEEQLDIEASYDMAPGANILVVGGDSCAGRGVAGLFEADEAVLDGDGSHPLASIDSNSWEIDGDRQPASWRSIEEAYLLRAAGEGVGMYFSSGDGSGVLSPSNDSYATAVGGTTLGIGPTGNRRFETGWSNQDFVIKDGRWTNWGQDGAAGGGVSQAWKEPSYQVGVVPASLTRRPGRRTPGRAVPDISADANQLTGILLGTLDGPHGTYLAYEHVGGTSLASPLVAGMVASAQQGQAEPFGFINPLIYPLIGTSALHDPVPLTKASRPLFRAEECPKGQCEPPSETLAEFDYQGKSVTSQVTLKGYDTMTGVGTPDGQAFVAALRRVAG